MATYTTPRSSTEHYRACQSLTSYGDRVRVDLQPVRHPLSIARYQTPLRYPGAKTAVIPHVQAIMEHGVQHGQLKGIDLLVEPFAGGASMSLRLLGNGMVQRVLLADSDPLIASFWRAAAGDTENLIDRMFDEHKRYVAEGGARAVARWDYWRGFEIPERPDNRHAILDASIKCLFLNRTTFSGILHGRAGPVGGRKQESPYTIGCRFHPEALSERIRYIGYLYASHRLVDVWQEDWESTLSAVPKKFSTFTFDRLVAYLDPPYIEKSGFLYPQSFATRALPGTKSQGFSHLRLAYFLRTQMRMRWILSYDDHPALLSEPGLYRSRRMTPDPNAKSMLGVKCWPIYKAAIPVRYTAAGRGQRGAARELLISSLAIPKSLL